MWKTHKKLILLTLVLTLLPIAVGVVLWGQLPDRMVTHWGIHNEPNGWMSRPMAVFGLPLICAALHLVCVIATDKDPRNGNIHRKAKTLVLWIIPAVTWVCSAVTYGYALGWEMNVGRICGILIGFIFIAMGNQMPKQEQNRTFGIRTKATLSDADVWRAAHRFGGWCFTVGGVVILLAGFMGWPMVQIAALLLLFIATLVYPALYAKKKRNC